MMQRDRSSFGRGRLAAMVLAAAVSLAGAWAMAQDQPPAPAAGGVAQPAAQVDPAASVLRPDLETGNLPTLVALYKTSPIINGIILILSMIAVLLFLFFMLTINTSAFAPTTFVDDVSKLVINRKYDEAANLCRANPRVFVATVIQRCAENAGKEHSVIMDMIDSEGRRRADIVWNRISYLADVANVAPMLGLLGTVLGMMQAFLTLPESKGNISSSLLSYGIGGAMATTFFGLIVAILATLFYTIVKSRATRSLATAEQVVHSVADHIKRGGA
jgi:biopolymer transport protein ExbB